MIIWISLIIPIVCIYLINKKYKSKNKWNNLYLIPIIITIILILVLKYSSEKLYVQDIEFWGSYALKTEYYEDWNEEVPCTHPKYCTRSATCTDSKGKSYSCTESYQCGYEHLYDVDYHPPRWLVTDSLRNEYNINSYRFDELTNKFGNKTFVDLSRDYHDNDGDKYVSMWDGTDEKLEHIVIKHFYDNRVQVSNSIFKYQEVDPKKFNLFEYPPIDGNMHQKEILSNYTNESFKITTNKLNKFNAKYGELKQIKLFFIIFVDKPISAGIEQEAYWKGGNKNEFVICIGVNKQGEVQWSHIFSWTEKSILKVDIKKYIINQKDKILDLNEIFEYSQPLLIKEFKRKEFKDFEYLKVDTPARIYLISVIIILIVNMIIFFIILRIK